MMKHHVFLVNLSALSMFAYFQPRTRTPVQLSKCSNLLNLLSHSYQR